MSTFIGNRAWFARRSVEDCSSLEMLAYSIIIPDADKRMLRGEKGMRIVEWGQSDGFSTAVRLEDGHHALIYHDESMENESKGYPLVHPSDNPGVLWSIWHAQGMPVPLHDTRNGRQHWAIPGIGSVRLFADKNKDPDEYRKDELSIDDPDVFLAKFPGYPIILEKHPREAFTFNYFWVVNAFDNPGDNEDNNIPFIKAVLDVRRDDSRLFLTRHREDQAWETTIDPQKVLDCMDLLAEMLHMPVRVVVWENGSYVWKGPFGRK